MTEVERRFVEIFSRKKIAVAHLQSQIHSYDEALSASLLVRRINPPFWLSELQLDLPIANTHGSCSVGGLEEPSIVEAGIIPACQRGSRLEVPTEGQKHYRIDGPVSSKKCEFECLGTKTRHILDATKCGDEIDGRNELLDIGDINGRRICWNGIPNTLTKYKEDQKIIWHGTPFEVRVEKALSDEKLHP